MNARASEESLGTSPKEDRPPLGPRGRSGCGAGSREALEPRQRRRRPGSEPHSEGLWRTRHRTASGTFHPTGEKARLQQVAPSHKASTGLRCDTGPRQVGPSPQHSLSGEHDRERIP